MASGVKGLMLMNLSQGCCLRRKPQAHFSNINGFISHFYENTSSMDYRQQAVNDFREIIPKEKRSKICKKIFVTAVAEPLSIHIACAYDLNF